MEKVEFKIPYTKYGTIFADKDGDTIFITGVSKDYNKKNIWKPIYKGFDLWKYRDDYAIYQQGKKFMGIGLDKDNNIVEVNFSKRPNRHVIENEKPENSRWYSYDIASYNEDKILSESINVFKRTEEEARIKAEKLFLKNASENRAKCGACERYIERWDEGNWDGVIYDHGFQQVGHRAGVCVGARYQPWEKSPEGKIAYIKDLESQKDWLLNNKPDEKLLAKLKKSVEIYVSFKKMLKELYEVNKKEYEESVRYFDRSDDDFIRWIRIYHNVNIEIQYPVNYLHSLHVWKETQLSELLNVWQAKVDLLTHLIINEQDKVDNWKAQLTPKEKRDASN